MPVTFSTSSAAPVAAECDLLALPVFAEREPGPGVEEIDAAFGGRLDAFMEEAGFRGKLDEVVVVPAPDGVAATAVALVGLGPADEVDARALRRGGAALARRARKATHLATTLARAADGDAAAAQALAEGIVLGGYQYLEHKSEGESSRLETVTSLGGGRRVARALERGAAVADATCWARDLVNEPAGSMSPRDVVAATRQRYRGRDVRLTVWDQARIEREDLGGLLGVNAGSDEPPRLVKAVYAPANARRTVVLVGKGITFDSGGLSLKPAKAMEWMKTDMGGGAAVLATMSVLADLGVRDRVVAFVPLTENMPSGRAVRPGDVLTIRNGTTVEVLNTDAEGRLVVADALCLAVEEDPDAIVDLATLTGACMVALGDATAGLMGNDDELVDAVEDAALRAGEPVWQLPLPDAYERQLDSEIADVKNIGGQYGGAVTAGLFLQRFVDDVPWAHLDIAGPARAGKDDGELVQGGTGFGVRTLVELLGGSHRSR